MYGPLRGQEFPSNVDLKYPEGEKASLLHFPNHVIYIYVYVWHVCHDIIKGYQRSFSIAMRGFGQCFKVSAMIWDI